MHSKNLFHCYLTILVLESLGYGYAIRRRKYIISGAMPPSETSKDCCHHGWYACCGFSSHGYETCQNTVLETIEQSEKCPYDKEERGNVRDHYCANVVALYNNLINDVIPKINAYAKCARSLSSKPPDSESYRNKQQIQTAVNEWHASFVDRYTKKSRTSCCGEVVFTGTEKIAKLETTPFVLDCTQKWAKALNHFISTVAYINHIETLGRGKDRERKCIRGCVGWPSFECVKTLFESVIPPSSSAVSSPSTPSSQQGGVATTIYSQSSSVHVP